MMPNLQLQLKTPPHLLFVQLQHKLELASNFSTRHEYLKNSAVDRLHTFLQTFTAGVLGFIGGWFGGFGDFNLVRITILG